MNVGTEYSFISPPPLSPMAGQTSGSHSVIEERIHNKVQKIFTWCPSELSIVPSVSGKKGSTYSGIFNKHFSKKSHLKQIAYRLDLFGSFRDIS